MGNSRRSRALPDPVQPGGLEDGDVQVVRSSTGEVFFRPSVRPRSWDRIGDEAQFILSGVQRMAGQMSELERHLEVHVHELRDLGASWDLIGWSLGLTGEGARRRYGDDDG